MATVTLEHVEKTYPNGARALLDCSLEVADGELLVLVGPSGCGKSTLLRLVAGLEEPSAGTIRIAGAVVNGATPQARNVAMVFQDYALYPHMTVRRNLAFPLQMRKLARAEIDQRVAKTADLLEIGALLDRLPKQLSGGQRQRVAMGRALVREPAVFLLDEPLSNLDAALRVQVRAEIAELQRRTGITMLYVTHDQVEAMTLGQRVAVLRDGRLQQVAPPRELYEHPANVFVAGFLGSPPMNLVPATLTRDRDGESIVGIGGTRIAVPPDRLRAEAPTGAGPLRVTAGIRPDALALARDGAGGIDASIEDVEWLGHEVLAYLRASVTGDARLVARLQDPGELARGTRVDLTIDARRLHLFADDGRALTR
jgi:ABC-type sugar transport system ATPase subunit